eukprot:jgi/Chrzof1/13645/Cz08g06020.t1
MPQYGEPSYWEERYAREPSAFDWYQDYTGLKPLIHKYLHAQDHILHVGVGTSRLQEALVKQGGYRHITNMDISEVVVSQMAEAHKDLPELSYEVADVRHMSAYADGTFDAVLDKGTLDAVLCGAQAIENVTLMLLEVARVLKPGGTFMLITYGDPSTRLPHLENPVYQWQVEVYCLSKVFVHTQQQQPISISIKGPFPAIRKETMDALSCLESCHFCYICTKLLPQPASEQTKT